MTAKDLEIVHRVITYGHLPTAAIWLQNRQALGQPFLIFSRIYGRRSLVAVPRLRRTKRAAIDTTVF
jgi:hypothetical protein